MVNNFLNNNFNHQQLKTAKIYDHYWLGNRCFCCGEREIKKGGKYE